MLFSFNVQQYVKWSMGYRIDKTWELVIVLLSPSRGRERFENNIVIKCIIIILLDLVGVYKLIEIAITEVGNRSSSVWGRIFESSERYPNGDIK